MMTGAACQKLRKIIHCPRKHSRKAVLPSTVTRYRLTHSLPTQTAIDSRRDFVNFCMKTICMTLSDIKLYTHKVPDDFTLDDFTRYNVQDCTFADCTILDDGRFQLVGSRDDFNKVRLLFQNYIKPK